jgi:hypothetical protein
MTLQNKANRSGKRRTRSPHPGVYLQARPLPGGGKAIRARYTDPDTERVVYETLDLVALSTRELRRDWAIRKSQTIARRRMDIAAGGAKRTNTALEQAVEDFFASCRARLSEKTIQRYGFGIERFRTWCTRTGACVIG